MLVFSVILILIVWEHPGVHSLSAYDSPNYRTDGGSFICYGPTLNFVQEMEKIYRDCYVKKWKPLPPVSPTGRWTDSRECCLSWNRQCQFEQTTRDFCNITDEKAFTQLVADNFDRVWKLCYDELMVDVSQSYCDNLKTSPVNDPICQKRLFCSTNKLMVSPVSNSTVPVPPVPDHPVSRTTVSNVKESTAKPEQQPDPDIYPDHYPDQDEAAVKPVDKTTTPENQTNIGSPLYSLIIFSAILLYFLF